MTYPKRVLIAIDQLFAVVLFGTMPMKRSVPWPTVAAGSGLSA